MATKLEKPLKREVMIGEQAYMLTISPEGLKLVVKGKRNGMELAWKALVSGDTALARLERAEQLVAVAPPAAQKHRDIGLCGHRGQVLELEEGHAP